MLVQYFTHKGASQIPQLSSSQLAGALPQAPTEEPFRLAAVILYVYIYFLISSHDVLIPVLIKV
jgi:hypothetical protein